MGVPKASQKLSKNLGFGCLEKVVSGVQNSEPPVFFMSVLGCHCYWAKGFKKLPMVFLCLKTFQACRFKKD